MKKEINSHNIGKISSFILTGILFIGILIGTIFGMKSAIVNSGSIDKNYNQKVTLQTNVDIKNKDKNIKDAAKSIDQTLNFLGIDNSKINYFGNDIIQITVPVNSFLKDKKPSIDEIYKISSNVSYVNEIESLSIALFFNGTLDFRTTDGASIFIKNGKGETIFNKDGVKPPDPQNYIKTSDAPIEMFGSASLKHSNGSPYIRLEYRDASESTINQYRIAFDDWEKYVEDGEPLDYAVWFDYDKLEKIAKKVDSNYDPESGLYNAYVSDGLTGYENLLKPFFINENTEVPQSKFDDYITLKNGQNKNWINEKSGTYFVNQINNSGNYKFSNVKVSLNVNSSKGIILIVMISAFILMIVVLIFLFSWYFGLLGFVASSIIMLSSLFNSLIYSSVGLSITGLGIASLIISLLIISFVALVILSIYKKNKDKSTSEVDKFKANFKTFNGIVFIPLTIFTLGLFLSGVLLSSLVEITIYLIVLFTLIGYLIMIAILFPIILFMDLFINFTSENNNDGKWSLINGVNKKFKNVFPNESDSKTVTSSYLTFSIAGVIAVLTSVLIGGLIFAFTGSPVNISGPKDTEYKYQVELISKPVNSIINDPSDTKTIAFLEQSYKNDEAKIKDIKKAFNSNGVKVRSINVERMDEFSFDDKSKNGSKVILEATYGYDVYSNKKIDSNNFNNINDALALIKVVTTDREVDDNTSGFQLSETSSLSNFDNNKSLKSINYSENKTVANGIYAILIFVLLSIVAFFLLFGWGVGSSYLMTSLLESSLILSPIFIFFLPYNSIIWFTLIFFTALSSMIKSYVSNSVKKSDLGDDVWFKKSREVISIIVFWALIFLGIQILLIFAYGFWAIASSIIITAWLTFVLCFSQYFVFPFYSKKLNSYKTQLKNNKKNNDILHSKNKDVVSEEYIEGINM